MGLTRGGMRAVLAVEAALTALVGTLLGIALGTWGGRQSMAVVAQRDGDVTLPDAPWLHQWWRRSAPSDRLFRPHLQVGAGTASSEPDPPTRVVGL